MDYLEHIVKTKWLVALRKESVDRNRAAMRQSGPLLRSLSARRAWIEIQLDSVCYSPGPSLSARRAWIEIKTHGGTFAKYRVALRKESVDRNNLRQCGSTGAAGVALRKESVDRNMILTLTGLLTCVALRKESVDRNRSLTGTGQSLLCRSPQGERG